MVIRFRKTFKGIYRRFNWGCCPETAKLFHFNATQGWIWGAGPLPPPGKLEMFQKNRTILLLFIVNKKPDDTIAT